MGDFKKLWGNIVKSGPKTNKDSSAQDAKTTTSSSDDEPDPVTAAPLEQMVKRRSASVTCTSEYETLPGHTMCMPDDKRVVESGISETDKDLITKLHNDYRGSVQPPATDLVKLIWDDRLAAVAQKWANQCQAAHDQERSIPSIGLSIGQNVAGGYRTWNKAVKMWWDEIRMWRYGRDPDSYLGYGNWRKIGHFTQMAQNGTYLLGCGYAVCANSTFTRYFVCDYAAGQSNLAAPYTRGRRCSACPRTCRDGQCDCGGLVCLNGGTLDPNTCQCKCPKLYGGRACDELQCPAEDNWLCGRDWPRSYCDRYYNVPWECPYMCGLCKGGGSGAGTGRDQQLPDKQTNRPPSSGSFTSSHGCRYTGKRASPEECKNYGDNGQDIFACGTQGGQLGCNECKRFFNVKSEMCPVMCGLCDPPCNGKKCENGGTLDTDSCQCSCVPPYSGERCENANCPPNDQPHCQYWSKNFCDIYYNVPEECPHMCGICG